MTDFEKMFIRSKLTEYLKETGQTGQATRFDVLAFCTGYFKPVTTKHIEVINEMCWDGLILY